MVPTLESPGLRQDVRESRPETGRSHQCARRCSVSVCWCHYRQWQGQVTSFILKDLGQIHLSP